MPNIAPTSTNLAGDQQVQNEDGPAVLLDVGSNATLSDVDSPNFDGGSLTVAITQYKNVAEDQLGIQSGGTVTVSGSAVLVSGVQIATFTGGGAGAAALVFTFDADATPAAVQALMRAITYFNSDAGDPSGVYRTITWTLVDGDGTVGGGTDTLTFTSQVGVIPVDDLPVAQPDALTTAENAILAAHLFLDNGSGRDLDPDGLIYPIGIGGPNMIIDEINGQDNLGTSYTLTLPSGATLHVDAWTGAIEYNPNGMFDYLVSTATGLATGALNTTATDSFTYKLRDGNTATVTVTITGVDGPGDMLIFGPDHINTMTGGPGDDNFIVDHSDDVIVEAVGPGNDRVFASVSYTLGAGVHIERLTTNNNFATSRINLTGNEFGQLLYGNAGNNVLDGKGGIDGMAGFGGDDSYYIDNAADTATEAAGEGSDRVFAAVSWTLAAGSHVERISTVDTSATTAINLTGNGFDNLIDGNAGNNVLDGGGGEDQLAGLGGDDTYYVDNAADKVIEATNQGTDRVLTKVSWALGVGSAVEQLATTNPTGSAAINLYGNEFDNVITGNNGANVLYGGAGIDTMTGFGGDDWYHVDSALDVVFEYAAGGANDRVLASTSYVLGAGVQVERLTTSSNTGTTTINLTGNEFANVIYGNDGSNILDGKGGADILIGMGGNNNYAFSSALGGGNIDTISGFNAPTDAIYLENGIFTALALDWLAAGAFNTGSAATQADDRIIYNGSTGALLYDADGVGAAAAIQFATLSTGLTLTNADFLVY